MRVLFALLLVLGIGCRPPQPVLELPEPLPPPQLLWRELPSGSSLTVEVGALVHDYYELDRAWKTREEQLKALHQSLANSPLTKKAAR